MDKKTEEMVGVGVGVLVLLVIIALYYYFYKMHPACAVAATDCTKNTKYPLCGLKGTTAPTANAKGRCIAGATVAVAGSAGPPVVPAVTVGGCPSGYTCA
jgi:hypothetical protein